MSARTPHDARPRARSTKSPLWARLCVVFGVLLVLGSGAVIVGVRVVADAANRSVNQEHLLPQSTQKGEHHATIKGPKNILLIGLDARPDQNPNLPIRSDSIMLLHVAASHDRAYLVSIPRDARVRMPANKVTGSAGKYDKINAAFAYGALNGGGIAGGVQLLSKTIQSISGIEPDAVAVINFTGFQKLVSVLKGVDMCIDEKTTSIHIGHTADGKYAKPFVIHDDGSVGRPIPGVTPEVYKPGCRHLAAWQALDYVRQRDLLANKDYDYGRQRHQQQFIKAVFKEVFDPGTLVNLGKLNQVLSATHDTMTVDTGDISVLDWVYGMRAITPSNLITIKTNAGQAHTEKINGIYYETLSTDSMQLLQAVHDDTVDGFLATHDSSWVSKS